MDNELRREFRAYKAETDDRIKRLEDAQKAEDAVSVNPVPQTASAKKAAGDAPSTEKDAN